MTALLKIGLVSVSDRASSGVYQDQGIPELQQWLEQALVDPFEVETRLIPDDQPLIEQTLKEWWMSTMSFSAYNGWYRAGKT